MANQEEHMLLLVQQTDGVGPIQQDVKLMKKKVNEDIRLVLSEITRIQKALQVDYLPPSTVKARGRKMSDPHRKSRDESASSALAVEAFTSTTPALMGPRKSKSLRRPASKAVEVESAELEVDDLPPSRPQSPMQKRFKDFGIQAEAQLKDTFVQTDGSWNELTMERLRQEKRKKRKVTSKEEQGSKSHTRAANFTPIDKLKEKATAAAMKKQYSVYDYYKDEGLMQRLARHPFFHNLTILVVIANSVWLGVDADLNTETILFNAHPAIIVGENFFCIYFTLEIIVRFLAFQRKLNAFKDFWFSFDLFLALLIIVETWVTPVLLLLTGDLSGLPEGTVLLRLIRLVRLVRLTRLTRLLRSFPELMIIVKGLAFATRSVCVFSLLWAIITYAFAIIMRSLTEGSTIGTTFFKTVPESINTLLLPAVFGANADVINAIAKDNPGLWPIMVFFMALVSVTIMYMLLGVLVDVIGAVASTEKQKIEITYIVGQLREELDKLSIIPEDGVSRKMYTIDMALDQLEFQKLVLEPGIVRVMHESGVNVEVLAEMLDLVWEDASKAGTQAKTFTFSELVNMVLGMRGSNPATVKDCKEQIRVTNSLIKRCFGELYEELEDKFYQVPACLPCLFPKYVGSSSPKITRAKRTIDFLSWEDG
ncbi:Ion_trans domain-containing protein [Durusdinium trenchii]|uniref:Ion_trans domain-containing protein n=1 Tax=Durusdinium trenchii TaxID=1381693 RepID=A0ABP0Q2R7_9DINO